MKWDEISVRTSHEAMDLVAGVLSDLGAAGVVIEDPALVNEYIHSGLWDYTDIPEQTDTSVVTVQAYLPKDEGLAEKIAGLRAALDMLAARGVAIAPGTVTEREIADEDWAENWKQYFHTVKMGERLVIQPSWEDYTPAAEEVVLRLDPGAAFGTGTHPTTAMCLRLLEGLVRPDMTVFDVGTGSGVLAIAAKKLGAGDVTAVDYDVTALKVAKENIAQNGLTGAIAVGQSDLWQNVPGRADLVIANIIADIILRLFDGLDGHLAADGRLLASGIIAGRAAEVIEGAARHGFKVLERRDEKEWVALVLGREGEA